MNSRSAKTLRWLLPFLAGVILVVLSGCLTPEKAVAEVDAETAEILAGKQEQLLGRQDPMTIDPPTERVAETALDGFQVKPGENLALTLPTILALAAKNSREFQSSKETLFRSAYNLIRSRENFRARPSGIFGGAFTSARDVESVSASSDFGITNVIERGGSYALSVGIDFLRFISSPTSESLGSFLNLTISLPFLRNADQNNARENLTQADREVLYSLRDFERFKQTYGVQVVSAYLRVLSQARRVTNEEANLRRLRYTRERNEALAGVGRIQKVQTDQARQQELTGETRLITTVQSLERAKDNLKDLLGLPVDLPVTISLDDLNTLEALLAQSLDIPDDKLIRVALRSRLDFRNAVDGVSDAERRVRLAENQLLPDLTLELSTRPVSDALKPLRYNFSDGTYSAAADIDLGLDRDLESVSLRSALVDLQRALRDQESQAEQVKLDVRNAMRQLARTREAFRIAKDAMELAKQRTAMTEDLLRESRVTTRDFLESQDALLTSQNSLVDALVEYRIAYLELFRDTGTLVVAPGGLDHETSRALLEVD